MEIVVYAAVWIVALLVVGAATGRLLRRNREAVESADAALVNDLRDMVAEERERVRRLAERVRRLTEDDQ